jgi:hypothetical protein
MCYILLVVVVAAAAAAAVAAAARGCNRGVAIGAKETVFAQGVDQRIFGQALLTGID